MRRVTMLLTCCLALCFAPKGVADPNADVAMYETDLIRVGRLIYGMDKSAVCFSDEFMRDIERHTYVRTAGQMEAVWLGSEDIFLYPFIVMTGEDSFNLDEGQREHLKRYLLNGGFLVASAGCSSKSWSQSFKREYAALFPEEKLEPIALEHPIYSSVRRVDQLEGTKRGGVAPTLYGHTVEGKIVVVFSEDGLNDTGKVGGDCCCCGGNELRNARDINMNLLGYALTH